MRSDLLAADLELEESFKPCVYKDSKGLWTIGIGILVDPSRKGAGLTHDEAVFILKNRITKAEAGIRSALPWYDKIPEQAQRALCDMVFQMGLDGVLAFENMITLLRQGRYGQAADEALNSKWAKTDTPARAKRVTDLMRLAGK